MRLSFKRSSRDARRASAGLPGAVSTIALLISSFVVAQGPLFGVIPTIGIGAPLAILALLFPTVFGGVFVLFRQWMAFITLISLNSTLLILQWYLTEYHPDLLRGTWWGDGAAVHELPVVGLRGPTRDRCRNWSGD